MPVGNPVTDLSTSGNFVPVTRTLTINGVSYDLSADRSWSIASPGGGSVTSVAMTVPVGFSISGSPITTAGTLAVTFSAGYSLPTTIKQSNWDDAYTWVSNFPTQTGNAGKFLYTNGSVLSWQQALLNPFTVLGQIVYSGVSGSVEVLNGNTTTQRLYLQQVGTGSSSAAPTWGGIVSTDVSGQALTKTDDTNVLLTLGGTPGNSVLNAVSLNLSWAGQLAVSRGGTGASTLTGVVIGNGTSAMSSVTGTPLQLFRVNAAGSGYEFFTSSFLSNPMNTSGDIIYGGVLGAPARLGANTTATNMFLRSVSSGIPSWQSITGADVTGTALTKFDDTNVTLTLSGNPATALLRATSLALGWSGTLSVSRGGSGASTLTGVLIGNGTSAFTAITGGPNQILRVNSTATGYEFFNATYLTNPMTLNGDMIAQIGGVPGRIAGPTASTKHFLTSTGTGSAANTPTWQTLSAADITGSALTRTNDTNVQVTLGGSASTALLNAASITMGWTGQLAVGRGGTGASTLTGVLIGNGTSAVTAVVGTAGQFLRRNTANTAYEFRTLQGGDIAGSELTFTNDTNVTMSLSGTPASALLQPVTIGLGWTGTLSVARGGIGVGTITGVMIGNGTSAVTGVTGTANQILRRNAGNTAYEFWSANYMVNPMNLEGQIIYALTGGTPAALSPNSTSTRKYLSQINGTAPTWEAINAISGSGTINYVPIWTSSTALGNSPLYITGSEANFGSNKLVAGNVSATNGSIMLQDNYSSGHLGNIGTMYSGGNLMMGYCVTPSTSSATGFLSSTTQTLAKSAIVAGEDIFMYTASAQSIAIGSAVSMTERIRLTNAGNLGIGISPSHKLDVNGVIGLSGTAFAVKSGGYNVLYDGGGSVCISMSSSVDNTNAYDNNVHAFRNRGGTVGFASISSAGVVSSADVRLPSTFNLTWGGAYGANIPTISGTSGTGAFLQFYPAGSSSGVKMALRATGQLALTSYTSSSAFTGTSVATLAVTSAGDLITIAPQQTTASGTYTPTWSGLANVTSVTAFSCQYMRVGDTVTVSGWVTIDPVSDNTPTRLSFSLPINSDTSVVNRLNGVGVTEGGGAAASIQGYATNFGEFEVIPSLATAVNYSFHFTYRLV